MAKSEPPPMKETGRYKVFLNNSERHVLVLRFPDREMAHPFNDEFKSKPTAIRIKPKSRLIEVDIPLPDVYHVDEARAIELGLATDRHDKMTKNAPLGIAGGFGQAPPTRRDAAPVVQPHPDSLANNFSEAMSSGHALNKITFSGQITPFNKTDPSYYLGTFISSELHLTKVSAFCTLSPGLQHLDALDMNEKAVRRADQQAAEEEKVMALTMQLKSGDDRLTDEGRWRSLLDDVVKEPWQNLEWMDENSAESFDVLGESLLVNDSSKSKRIAVTMSKQQYLDSISTPRVDPAIQRQRIKSDGTLAAEGDDDTTDESEEDN